MHLPRQVLLVLAVAALVAACATEPSVTPVPASVLELPSDAPSWTPDEVGFEPGAWPRTGSACDHPGYHGLMGRIEGLDARTVRFSLCRPDGAFLSRIADPSLAILDTATIERLAADPAAASRTVAGTGPYRIERWEAGSDAILVAADDTTTSASGPPTIVLRWEADPARRVAALRDAAVDGIDAPDPGQLDALTTQPEIAITPRPGMATAFLAFGNDRAFDDADVRRAIAGSLDRAALVEAAFPQGSVVPTHVTPCVIPAACEGENWYEFNAPGAAASLAAAGFDLRKTWPLHVPDQPVPGLPDPLGAAQAVAGQLATSIGLQASIDVMPAGDLEAAAADGSLDGLYLGGIASRVADPGAFLGPLFGAGVTSTPAHRARGVRGPLAAAAAAPDAAAREAAYQRANDAIRDAAPLVPLANPGSAVAFRADVQGVVASPLGIDPLGGLVPGDRRQLAFMQASEPGGAYCGDQPAPDAVRLCALVTEPLYAFAPGSLDPRPALAQRCVVDAEAMVWTCTLRRGVRFQDGTRLDAGDVLASYAAASDATAPLHAAMADADWSAWTARFGAGLPSSP